MTLQKPSGGVPRDIPGLSLGCTNIEDRSLPVIMGAVRPAQLQQQKVCTKILSRVTQNMRRRVPTNSMGNNSTVLPELALRLFYARPTSFWVPITYIYIIFTSLRLLPIVHNGTAKHPDSRFISVRHQGIHS
jgi:hypothetical protein